MNLFEFVWIKTTLVECNKWNKMNLHAYINMILFKIMWFIPNLYEFIRICFEFIYKYARCQTAAHCRTAGQPHTAARTAGQPHTAAHTAAHTATLPDIAVRSAAHCSTLHEFECRTAAQRTPHTAYRTQSHTVINMI